MKELYQERRRLIRSGSKIRILAMDDKLSKEKTFELREQQDKQYKKYKFIDGFIKAREKLGGKENE